MFRDWILFFSAKSPHEDHPQMALVVPKFRLLPKPSNYAKNTAWKRQAGGAYTRRDVVSSLLEPLEPTDTEKIVDCLLVLSKTFWSSATTFSHGRGSFEEPLTLPYEWLPIQHLYAVAGECDCSMLVSMFILTCGYRFHMKDGCNREAYRTRLTCNEHRADKKRNRGSDSY